MGLRILYVPDVMPVQILYGDGTPIPPDEMAEIRRATWDHSVLFRWKKGDVLVLDNILTAHGRMKRRSAQDFRFIRRSGFLSGVMP